MGTFLAENILKDNFPPSPLAHTVSSRNTFIGEYRNDVLLPMYPILNPSKMTHKIKCHGIFACFQIIP